jgi:hypothetical protein
MKKGDWITTTEFWSPMGELWATSDDPLVGKILRKKECVCCADIEPIAGGRFWTNRPVPEDGYIISTTTDKFEVYTTDAKLPAWAWAKIAEKDMTE